MKRSALLATIILLTLSLVAITWQLRSVVVSLLVALAIVATLEAPVEWLVQHRWSRPLAAIAVYLVVFGALLGVISAIFVPIISELDPLAQDLVAQYGTVYDHLLNLSGAGTDLVTRLPAPEQLATSLTAGQTTTVLRSVLGVTENLGSNAGQLILAMVLAIYLTMDHAHFERLWLSLLPPSQRSRTRRVWHKVNADVGGYVRSEVAQTVLAGALLAGGYWLIGINYPFLLAFLAAVAWLVPLLGGVFALIPLVTLGWLSGPLAVLLGLIYTVGVLVLMEFLVERRLYRHERYWGVLVVLVMMTLGDALGLLGLLVAPPIAVAMQIWINEILDAPVPGAVDLTALETKLADIHARVYDGETDVSQRHASLVTRLDGLLADMKEEGIASI